MSCFGETKEVTVTCSKVMLIKEPYSSKCVIKLQCFPLHAFTCSIKTTATELTSHNNIHCFSEYYFLSPTFRLNSEAKEKKCFLNSCQDSGILEFLPYHKCDHTSRDQPDYLTCLVRLQVQNISARYPLFITGEILLN